MDGIKKKKKKSRKSKHKDRSSKLTEENGAEHTTPQDEDAVRPSKRKRESEFEPKKKKTKKTKTHHTADDYSSGAAIHAVEDEQNQSAQLQQELPEPEESSNRDPNDVKATSVATPAPQVDDVGYETTGELNKKGKLKKQRGSRIGGKNNLKVGFFTSSEVERLETHKLDFCNLHGLSGQQFDEMIQHSERQKDPFPCSPSICSKTEFWADIYGIIPDRDRRSVYRFMRRHFQVTTQKPHEWTDEQDEELVTMIADHGPRWAFIAKLLGRSDDDVTQRWKNKLEHRGTMNRGAWHEEETRAFLEAMRLVWEGYKQILHEGAGNDMYELDEKLVGWGAVSNSMNNMRSRQQCADKWRKLRRAVMAKRAAGFPDAVFDCTKVKKSRTHNTEPKKEAKSSEYVNDEDDDDDGNVGEDSLPPTAPATPAPEHGFADQQMEMVEIKLQTQREPEPSEQESSPPQQDIEIQDDPEPEVNHETPEPESPAPANNTTSPAPPATPLSASGQKRNEGRMARIKEKIKAANKANSSKKRRRSEVEQSNEPEQSNELEQSNEPEPEPEPEAPHEQSLSTEQLPKRERRAAKKEKKRKKREKKEREERERLEAEAAEAAAQQGSEKKKAKKHKKNKQATDSSELVEATAASTPEKRRKKKQTTDPAELIEAIVGATPEKQKKKRRQSDAEPNGTATEEREVVEPSPKKHHAEKQKATEQEDHSAVDQRVHENSTTAVEPSRRESSLPGGFSDDSESIKSEETDSD